MSIVVCEFVDDTGYMSNHFECASTIINHSWLWYGPAWSICILDHGRSGHSHGCSGALAGAFWFTWHVWQDFTLPSIAWSNLGHHNVARANPFIFVIPGWHACSSSNTRWRPRDGTITLLPHSKHCNHLGCWFHLSVWNRAWVFPSDNYWAIP